MARSPDSSVGIVKNCTAVVQFPLGVTDFCLLLSVYTGSGAHSASYPMGTVGSFPGGKDAWGIKLTSHLHLVPRSRMVELYLHSPIRPYANFTFYIT
jgi:hypothetical protein